LRVGASRAAGYVVVVALVVVLIGVSGHGPLGFLKRSANTSSASSVVGASSGATKNGTPKNGTTTTTVFQVEARSYNRGDCITFDQTPNGKTHEIDVVTCDRPHLMEMTVSIDVTGRFDRFPSGAIWKALFQHDCAPSIRALMGAPLDPVGRFYATGVQPSPQSWADGDRTVWCGVGAQPLTAPARGFEAAPFTGKVEGAPQARVYPVGSCLGSDSGYVIPCRQAHEVEVTGYVDLTGKVGEPPAPGNTSGWQALVGPDCVRAARSYLGHGLVNGESAGWNPIQPGSWATGRRVLECTVGRYRADRPVSTVGSLKS
jgi:hypothetical protein